MNKTIQSEVADTVLERNQTVQIGKKTFEIAPPTIATLILVSELVATMPAIKLDSESIMTESLMIAKDCRPLGEIVAVLILGAKNVEQKRSIWHRFGIGSKPKDVVAELAKYILLNISAKQLNEIIVQLLSGMEISFFFSISTSLIEINLIRATREVVKTTASGQ
jgi:hypothetical protein